MNIFKRNKSKKLANRYFYGMHLRGYAPNCQPMEGLVTVLSERDVDGRHYHNILCYNRMLTEEELFKYELDLLNSPATGANIRWEYGVVEK